ncbi:MAG: hypothetical protein NVSMB51_01250 [Solirubrobacteraceae bacterium]
MVHMSQVHKIGWLRPRLSGVVLRSQSDARLVALAAAGNEPAFAAIVERYKRELHAHAGRIVRRDGAEDVVQQAMFKAWTALLAGADIRDLRPWLHQIVHNAAISTVTRRGYDDSEIPAASVAPHLTEELAEGRLGAAQTLAAIAALPDSQRRALTLTAIDGHSGSEAALAMGISESAMRQLVYRARSSVRSAASAFVPLPLLTWLTSAGGGTTATLSVVGLGAASGATVAVTKAVAVLAVAGAALGGARALTAQPHQHRKPASVSTPARQPPAAPWSDGGPASVAQRQDRASAQLQQSVEAANTSGGTRGGQGTGNGLQETVLTSGANASESAAANEVQQANGPAGQQDRPSRAAVGAIGQAGVNARSRHDRRHPAGQDKRRQHDHGRNQP